MTHIVSYNPSNNAILGKVAITAQPQIEDITLEAHDAFLLWKKTPLKKRVDFLREAYGLFLSRKEELAQSVASEMGMPIKLARDEVQYGLNYFIWYLDNAEKYLSPEVTYENEGEIHTVYYEPKGVIAAITPWNYPFMLFAWACIQPLLAGNTVIWKVSKEVILTGKLIASIMNESNIPKGVWSEVYGDGAIGDFLTDLDIDGIAFTGSTNVGNHLAKKGNEKGIPVIMELGGSAPGIVCEDADIDAVLETIYFMRFSNSGQMCDGLKRLIVHASRYDELVKKLSKRLLEKKMGDALDETVDIGPIVSEKQKLILLDQYNDALEKGAKILAENKSFPNDAVGSYFPATLLGNIQKDMKVWKEEVFGPILPIISYNSLEEAIELANDTLYGLGAYVFTKDMNTFHILAHAIESGMVQCNNINYCIPQDPFGGYKSSGIGREHGKWGFYEFVNIKVISLPKTL
ncbi:MAG: succinate-semialdehyde dehydrogenase [Candidatus Altimarinota bacterium]